ncbi:MAG: enoyl-CoA hydratase [Hyphomicrobiaceae bacterium]|nr:enoyl-CoA hydratase [Hyphomicrobiaceae bacterium]
MTVAVRPAGEVAGAAPSGVEVARDGAVLVLTLARPEQRNALSEGMLAALQKALDDAARQDWVRAIVIAAKGPVFSSGHDLKEITARRADPDNGRAYTDALMRTCARMMRSIVAHPRPVIAAVTGTASAAGCQLVASCDLAVAADTAQFCTPGVNIGLFCSTPMVALSRNVPRKRAMEMLLLGEMLSAADAAEFGLVNKVVPKDDVLPEAMAFACRIASKPPVTVATGKEAFYRQLEMPLAEAYDYAAAVMVENMMHAESKEGIGAFIDKRPPDWSKA